MTGENAGGATARVPQLAAGWVSFGNGGSSVNIPEEAKLA